MSSDLADLGYTGVPVAAAAVAGLIAVVRRPGERVTSGLQHFAAGVVFAAAAIELIPKVLQQDPPVAITGFAIGIVVMFSIRAFTQSLERRQDSPSSVPLGLIGAAGIDFLVDGAVLGAGFTAGGQTGLLLTIAIAIEYLFVGLSLSAALGPSAQPAYVATLPAALSLLTVLGALIGVVALSGASSAVLAGVLAFGSVVFMYLVTEELLVQAHERGETSLGSVAYFLGFLLYLVLKEVLG